MNLWKYPLTKPLFDQAEVRAIEKVLDSGWLAEGKITEQFEHKVAEYVGATYAVAVANCTVALELCLKVVFDIGEVTLPDFTHPATIQAIINVGRKPQLKDVDVTSYDTNDYTTVSVSWGGNPRVNRQTTLIEDAACSLGAMDHNEKVGSLTDATCFSFHPRKLITCGEGGMVTTDNEPLADRIRLLKNFGEGGGNYKLDDVRAAIGLVQMDKLESIIVHRIKMAQVYTELLRPYSYIKPPQVAEGVRHTFQTYAVYLEKGNRDEIVYRLREKGIETQRGAYALHLLPQFKDVERIGDLHNSELLDTHLLALPMAYTLTEEDQKFVVDEVSKACNP